jgi:Rieske Fe-S protein
MAHDPNIGKSTRRNLISGMLMGIGLVAGYGLGLFHFLRYLIPSNRRVQQRKMFVGTLDTIAVGSSLTVKDPRGREIAITRTSDDPADPASGFKALSSKCPHLGCNVHYVPGKQEFFCPCHDGVFDRDGIAVSGPPAKENKNLTTYEIKVDTKNGSVFVMVSPEFAYGLGA